MTSKTISIPEFSFNSDLARLIVELERVREKFDHGTTDERIFFELKDIFQLVTSMTSARIEGNHTTVIDVVDALNEESDNGTEVPDEVREIVNIQQGIRFIEEHVQDSAIDKEFICQLHRIVVHDLIREGDSRAGAFRTKPVKINKSSHVPPAPADIDDHMQAMVDFIAESHGSQFDLMKDAIVHHRFVWIHPFTNGNGRVARLLTYAMMAKQGFIDASGIRALNPTAVFGSNREDYYEHLSKADSLLDKDIQAWSFYMLGGVKGDLDKVASLLDAGYVRKQILLPAIKDALDRQRITDLEYRMLRIVAQKGVVQASDFETLISGPHVLRSRAILKLRKSRLLQLERNSTRRYRLQLSRNAMTGYVMKRLDEKGLLPSLLRD